MIIRQKYKTIKSMFLLKYKKIKTLRARNFNIAAIFGSSKYFLDFYLLIKYSNRLSDSVNSSFESINLSIICEL